MNIKEIQTLYYLATAEVAKYLLGITYENGNPKSGFSLFGEDDEHTYHKFIRVVENSTGNEIGSLCLHKSPYLNDDGFVNVSFGLYLPALENGDLPDDVLTLFDQFAVERLGLLPDDYNTLIEYSYRMKVKLWRSAAKRTEK